jgi:hypothetical protein
MPSSLCFLAAIISCFGGAQATVLGTRFLASAESRAHPRYKQKLLQAGEEDTVRSILFGHGLPNAPHRTLRTAFVGQWLGQEARGQELRPDEPTVGRTVGGGQPIKPAGEIVRTTLRLIQASAKEIPMTAAEFRPLSETERHHLRALREITIMQLLQHTAGWDMEKSFDPIGRPIDIAIALRVPPPAKQGHVIRYMFGRPLDFDPGSRYAYSNFGYCVLGEVIYRVSGQSYEDYVRKEILGPLGIRRMRLGKSLEA